MRTPRPDVQASFDELTGCVSASIGVAIAYPGTAGGYSLGDWSTGVAWSTIKVPLAIAALRGDPTRAEPLVVKAITESDNPASEGLWSALGEPAIAARQVQAVIAAAGDPATVVQAQRVRPGFTAFGQTQWPLSSQAQFAANLADVPGSAFVIDLMHQLAPRQRWGLAAKGIAAKGGWGPGLAGDYLVRQFGMLPVGSGRLGAALAAEAPTFEIGVKLLTTMAEWLMEHLPKLISS